MIFLYRHRQIDKWFRTTKSSVLFLVYSLLFLIFFFFVLKYSLLVCFKNILDYFCMLYY